MRYILIYFILIVMICWVGLHSVVSPVEYQSRHFLRDNWQNLYMPSPPRYSIVYERFEFSHKMLYFRGRWESTIYYAVSCKVYPSMQTTCIAIVLFGSLAMETRNIYIYHWY